MLPTGNCYLLDNVMVRVRKALRSHGHRPEEGPRRTIEAPMTHPSHAQFLLFCEEGLPSGIFLSGRRLITFLDSGYGFELTITVKKYS